MADRPPTRRVPIAHSGAGDRAVVCETLRMSARSMDLAAFVALETQVWEALRHGDAEADRRLLAEDFLGVYPTGFADRSGHVGELRAGPTVAEYELHDARIKVLSDDDVLLAYRADWRAIVAGERGERESMYVSSLWSRRAGTWVNVFSHDCPSAI
jgi:hypothetical protein